MFLKPYWRIAYSKKQKPSRGIGDRYGTILNGYNPSTMSSDFDFQMNSSVRKGYNLNLKSMWKDVVVIVADAPLHCYKMFH